MGLVFIALHREEIRADSKIVGFRLYDEASGQYKDVTYGSVYGAMLSGAEISGLEMKDGIINGSNGQLSRYSYFSKGIPIGKQIVVVLEQSDVDEYKVVTPDGRSEHMMEKYLIDYAQREGLANGKVVSDGEKSWISSISGEYKRGKKLRNTDRGNDFQFMYTMVDDSLSVDSEGTLLKVTGSSEEIIIPPSVKKIAPGAFQGCDIQPRLIRIPGTVKVLSANSIGRVETLEEVILSEGLEEIQTNAFFGCTKLSEQIVVPSTVKVIRSGAFSACFKLKKVILKSRQTVLEYGFAPMKVKIEHRDSTK